MKRVISLLMALSAVSATLAQPKAPSLLATITPWKILRSVDPMTDAPSCFGVHQSYPNVQLSPGAVYVDMSGRGGVKGYQYRLNDTAASPMELPSQFQRRTNILVFGEQVGGTAIMTSDRLRIQVLTVLGDLANYDIDMVSSGEVLKLFASSKCR